jgi:hypothetical protein
MIVLLCFVSAASFKSKSRLEAENAALRHQLVVLCRMVHRRVRLTNNDRLYFIQLYRWFPWILQVLMVIHPESLVRWHSKEQSSVGMSAKMVGEIGRIWRNATWRSSLNRVPALQQVNLLMTRRRWQLGSQRERRQPAAEAHQR